jgi:hypothetical protein
MLRPILGLAAVGAVGYVAWQVLWAILLPLVGTVVGFALLVIKILFFAMLILVGVWVLKRLLKQEPKAA